MKASLKNREIILARLRVLEKNLKPDSIAIRVALTKIAIKVTNQAKINIRNHGLIDTGRLINSVRWENYREKGVEGVRIGSFGVPYAAFWEFGFRGRVKVREHQRSTKRGQTTVRQHMRLVNNEGRPYLRPALELHRSRIITILGEAINA